MFLSHSGNLVTIIYSQNCQVQISGSFQMHTSYVSSDKYNVLSTDPFQYDLTELQVL